jgi:hypothetical protein
MDKRMKRITPKKWLLLFAISGLAVAKEGIHTYLL